MANNTFVNPFPTLDDDSDDFKVQVTNDPEPDVESYLVRMEEYLTHEFPKCILIPVKSDGQSKQPGWCHKGITDASLWQRWTQRPSDMRECDQGLVMTMRHGMIVIDFDDVDTARGFTDRFPAMLETAVQQTTKGFHFIFKRTAKCDSCNLYDGARCISDPERPGHKLPIDIKTVCKTGTGGILSLYPSEGKRWLRPMYEFPPIDIPDSLVEFLGAHLASSGGATKRRDDDDQIEVICTRVAKRSRWTGAIDLVNVKNIVDMLSDERARDPAMRMQVGWCLYNIDSHGLLDAWLAFNARCPDNKYVDEARDMWVNNTITQPPGVGIGAGALHMWAKHDRPLVYQKYMREACTRDVGGAIGASYYTLAKIVHKVLFDRFVYTGNNHWYCLDHNNRWCLDGDQMALNIALSTVVFKELQTIARDIDHFLVDDDSCDGSDDDVCDSTIIMERITEFLKMLHDTANKTTLIKESRAFFYDKNFVNLLDSKINLLAFQNGAFDLNTMQFRDLRPEDYVSLTTKLTWCDQKNDTLAQQWVAELEKVHPEPTRREYFVKSIARDLYGDSGKQLCHIHAGHNATAANGKTQLFQVLQCALGDYMRKMPIQMLVTKTRPDPKRPDTVMSHWPGLRLLYCTEPDHTETLNSGILKDLTGGETQHCRNLRSAPIVFKPQFKIHVMSNAPPAVDGTDEGIRRRMRKLDYLASFVDDESQVDPAAYVFKSDRSFLEQIEQDSKLALEVVRYFLEHFDKNYAYTMPDSVRQDSSAYLDENDPIKKMVNDVIVAEPGAMFSLTQIKAVVRANPSRWGTIAPGTLKSRLSKCLGAECVPSRSSVPWDDGTRPSNYWVGFKIVA